MNITIETIARWDAGNAAGDGYAPAYESMDEVAEDCEACYLDGAVRGYRDGRALILDSDGPWAVDVFTGLGVD